MGRAAEILHPSSRVCKASRSDNALVLVRDIVLMTLRIDALP